MANWTVNTRFMFTFQAIGKSIRLSARVSRKHSQFNWSFVLKHLSHQTLKVYMFQIICNQKSSQHWAANVSAQKSRGIKRQYWQCTIHLLFNQATSPLQWTSSTEFVFCFISVDSRPTFSIMAESHFCVVVMNQNSLLAKKYHTLNICENFERGNKFWTFASLKRKISRR